MKKKVSWEGLVDTLLVTALSILAMLIIWGIILK